MLTRELLQVLRNRRYVIYGAGYVADNLCKALSRMELLGNLEAFVTSSGSPEIKYGKPIKTPDEIELNNYYVLIAVHETIKDEIERNLLNRGLKDYCWIYPNIYELMLGEPLEEQVEVSIRYILEANIDNLMIPIRYAAIEEYFGKRDDGFQMYIDSMGLHCEESTARKRLESFKGLIKDVESEGLLKDKPISILENNTLIDGAHRLAIAIYKGYQTITANIYQTGVDLDDIHGARGSAKESKLSQVLDENTMQKLLAIRNDLLGRYKD